MNIGSDHFRGTCPLGSILIAKLEQFIQKMLCLSQKFAHWTCQCPPRQGADTCAEPKGGCKVMAATPRSQLHQGPVLRSLPETHRWCDGREPYPDIFMDLCSCLALPSVSPNVIVPPFPAAPPVVGRVCTGNP